MPRSASAVKFAIPLLAATAVFFQIFIPVGSTLVNVNLADPVAILGGSLFVFYVFTGGVLRWRLGRLNGYVALATAVIVAAFLHGYYLFGWSDWAFTNKLLGWFIVLGYGATGALIVKASPRGIFLLVRTFVAAAAGITAFEIVSIAARSLGLALPPEFIFLPLDGFSQNRNAFAFVLLLSICAIALMEGRIEKLDTRRFASRPVVCGLARKFRGALCRAGHGDLHACAIRPHDCGRLRNCGRRFSAPLR